MKRSGREEKKEVKRRPVAAAGVAGDYIGSTLEMEVTLLLLPVPGCCCSEKEARLAPPKLAPPLYWPVCKESRHYRCFSSEYNSSCLRHFIDMS